MEGNERKFLAQALAADDVVAVAKKLGISVVSTPVEGPALRAWGLEPQTLADQESFQVLGAEPGFRLLHLSGPGPWKRIRRAMIQVHRASPESTILWWWSSPTAWTMAMVDDVGDGRRRVKKLVLEKEHPDEVGMMQWLALAASRRVAVESADGWREHILQVLDQDGVTRDFFRGFSHHLDELIESMKNGPQDEELRHDIALGTLLRVVFLYFLQARGALDGDRRFVMRRFFEYDRQKSFYRAVLRPLFFGALNCPAPLREQAARQLGDLPFLNGGLFEPSAAEERFDELDWDDQVWRELLEGLFERHRFAVEWSDDADLCCAVDPEMLGKVFEGLMYGDRRRRSASFYTPRDVVRSMVSDTVAAWLVDAAELDEESARHLVEDRAEALSAGDRRRAREALADLTVLDPAVGTGAFLLEVLRLLRRIDGGLDRAEGVVRTPGERYDRMRSLVHDHLCGVDIQPTAVRLCELRIWLAMLAALPALPAQKMPPLPNLSHRLCTGNSLIEPLDWFRFRVGGEAGAFGRSTARFDRRSVERLAVLQKAYTRAHGSEKRELKQALDECRLDVERRLIDQRLTQLRSKLEPFEALQNSKDLFGEGDQMRSSQRADERRLRAEFDALKLARCDLDEGRRRETGFCFDAQFAPIMARGGFDLVVTNPPWVRTRRIDGGTRKLYRARYATGEHRLWPEAKSIGVRAPFGSQVDLASLFLERSLELLRPGGRLCALVPVKLFRSLHGSGVRGVLADHSIEYLEDRSEDEEAMFDATTYPAIIRVKKETTPPPAPTSVDVNVWRRGSPERFSAPLRNLCVHGGDVREPWMLVEPAIEAIFRKMQQVSTPLGGVESMPICGGVKTGCNAAFVMSDDEAKKRFSPAVRAQYLRWAVRGRDIEAPRPQQNQRIIWPVDKKRQIAPRLPPELEAHFEEWRQRLEGRSDYRSGPIWTLFRRREHVENPGVAWRDMGEQLEAALIDAPSIPLNTVYYLPAPDEAAARAVVELFHSEPMRAIAFAVGERARGGWRRHFAWVMKMLPVPRRWLSAWEAGDNDALTGEEAVRQAYGLSRDDIHSLACWRRGVAATQRQEVA